MKPPKELFEENAECVHPEFPNLMNKDTFIRLWNEYQPKWVSVKERLPEIFNVNDQWQRSKAVYCWDGENSIECVYEKHMDSEPCFYSVLWDDRIENVKLWMDRPPLPTEK